MHTGRYDWAALSWKTYMMGTEKVSGTEASYTGQDSLRMLRHHATKTRTMRHQSSSKLVQRIAYLVSEE